MSIFLNPAFILTAFMAFVMQMIWNYWSDVPLLTGETSTETAVTRNINMLQSHPRCGLTSGGREECWWGCDRPFAGGLFTVIFMIELQLLLCHSPHLLLKYYQLIQRNFKTLDRYYMILI